MAVKSIGCSVFSLVGSDKLSHSRPEIKRVMAENKNVVKHNCQIHNHSKYERWLRPFDVINHGIYAAQERRGQTRKRILASLK